MPGGASHDHDQPNSPGVLQGSWGREEAFFPRPPFFPILMPSLMFLVFTTKYWRLQD